ncbi:TPA: hypothetical protein NJL49_006818 [Pseudomonas aeruginosa]|uniref:hypothetical protein n=2 Tax=Pseudomonas aeruginosa TaxID=287 RepID=UPI00068FC8B7|nr:hypothetical protein [Pseudomonas aeruginosa]HCG0623131.1 hypothetical protein [Pseudomonas aeruginosa]HCG0743554.1 hypothetical protein [Pseudomonas aeruginosa]HCG1151092.1 hypothetical protein [Pseudomonas aeruginosa]HCG1358846.1 hypothetical protein [Pseudomonas aeruginosa]HCG1472890.1 hypothetical protein [Pseudomonas aeruginosa]
MTDFNRLKVLAERARDKGDWYKASSVDAFPEFHVDQEFMVATSPDVVLWLIAEVERLEAELSQCAIALPGTYYMDPPDGGNVSIPEQIRRMAKDAARYRWLIASAWYVGPDPEGDTEAVSWHDHNDTMHGVTTAIDAAIEGAKQ